MRMNSYAERLKHALEKRGRTQTWLADQVGVKPQAIQYLCDRGSGSKHSAEIAQALNINLQWLTRGQGDMGPEHPAGIKESSVEYGIQVGTSSRVPVVGNTQAGPDRVWTEEGRPAGYGDQYLDAPSKDPHAYALRVRGTSMSPWAREGEVLLVAPSEEPHAGDEVVVCLTNGEVMVKSLVYQRPWEIALDSINHDYSRITVAPEDVEFMHVVDGRYRAGRVKQNID